MSLTDSGAADPHRRFRSQLLDAGLLLDGGVEGLYLRSSRFEAIVVGVDRAVSAAGADLGAEVLYLPPIMARSSFERSDYLRAFPDLVGTVNSFMGNDRSHAELLRRLGDGESYEALLEPTGVVLCSAACHSLYPICRGRLPDGGRDVELFGTCFRHEPSVDPARMQSFRQHEFVHLGTPDSARAHRDRWVERGLDLLGGLGLDVTAEVANDPFFGRVGQLLAAGQRNDALKVELLCPVTSAEAPTAVASANCALDHFAAPFGIEDASGATAHTACVGFGIERVALALLATHGLDPERWAPSVRTALSL